MYNSSVPLQGELPSTRALLRSTGIAAAVALVLLVTVVLPAEYGVDPTRIGRVLGLTQMGEIKMALAAEAEAATAAEAAAAAGAPPQPAARVAAAPTAPAASDVATTSHVTELALAPGEGKEIKLAMQQGARVSFSWTVQGGVVNYDTHADRPGLSYHGYKKGAAVGSDEGVLVAAFDGMHGWFWRNRSSAPVTLTLRTDGEYSELKHVN